MVLSNTKLKRRKREEAVAVAALAPPPDSNGTPSSADVVMGDSPAVLSAKKKKRPKAKKANGDEADGTVVNVPVNGENGTSYATPEVAVEGSDLPDEGVKKSKRRKNAPEVATQEIAIEAENAGGDPGVAEVNGGGVAASEASAGQGQGEEAPKTKIRKKPRWEVDESGKRRKPQKPGVGDGGPPDASTSSDKGTEEGGDANGSAEKHGDAAAAAPDGDRIHQGDEPWLQSKRSKKKKKKLLDKWGKKVEDAAAAVADEQPANQEAPLNGSSTEEKVDPKKVMVGGMPYYITEDDIHEFFKECGTIAELDCMTFPDTGKFKGIAFITFRTDEAAKRALALDGADMGGRFLKIEICKIRPREPTKKDVYKEPPKKHEGCLSAYIGNLSWDVTEKELRKFFKGCKIDAIRFATNKETGEFRGFGHVDFADDESLEAAMKHDQMPILDRPLKIAYSVPPKNKPADGRPAQSGAKKKGCFTCGEEGHMSYNCPKKI